MKYIFKKKGEIEEKIKTICVFAESNDGCTNTTKCKHNSGCINTGNCGC